MSTEEVSRWLERYVTAWKSGERAEIEALFCADARYRYHPYDEPLVGHAAIADSWLEDPDKPGSFDASYECFVADGEAAVAIGTSTYFGAHGDVLRVYDNVFVLRFDAREPCSEFTEWYVKRPHEHSRPESRPERPPSSTPGPSLAIHVAVQPRVGFSSQ